MNYEVLCAFPYRVMRNADLTIEEDEAADLLMEIEKQIKRRQWGEAIRLQVEAGIDKKLLKVLKKELRIKEDDIFHINGPLDLTFLMKLSGMEGYDELKVPKYTPQQPKWLNSEDNLFAQIRDHDVLLHHPYETFDPVVTDTLPCQQPLSDHCLSCSGCRERQTGYRSRGTEGTI